MGEKVVIVESPAKARTIQKYLGKGYKVTSSMGHVRDLPKNGLAIDIEHDFAPSYEIVKPKVVSELNQAVRNADAIYLATDPDREGEAIAWHITQAVKTPKKTPIYRVVFQEITRNAVQQALQQPRQINQNLVDAQQARRVLDRLVGYQLSPLLWDKVKRGLSAGRVQSVAVRLIVEREREIENFKPQEYWTIEADLLKEAGIAPRDLFRATLIERDGKKLEKFSIERREQAEAIVADLQGATYTVLKVTRRDKRRSPPPPFTTSTLQQEAARKLGFSAKKTMMLAQRLYEGVDIGGEEGIVGLITYMRTDSVQVAAEAQAEAREVIDRRFGREYLPDQPPVYKTKAKGAQEAHEAIRPTSSARTPEQLSERLERDLWRLYDLIWKRFIASQMAPAIFDSTTVDIAAQPSVAGAPPYLFRATGSVLKFPGFLAVYNVSLDEGEEDEDSERRLPPLVEGENLQLVELLPVQHFTEPPPRYTEASLVKELERLGIGRPSTYATILSTIQEREYVEMVDKKLIPTTLGRVVTDLLVEHFGNIVDYDFTSSLEQQLDDIAEGAKKWVPVLREFYGPFRSTLETAQRQMRNVKREEIITDLDCPKCGKGKLVIKFGRNGEFLACSRYNREGEGDSCDFTSDFHRDENGNIVLDQASAPETSDVLCNVCGRPMVIKKSRFGPFLGCSGYPECTNTRRIGRDGKPVPLPEPTGVTCPKCGEGELLRRRGKFGRPFYGCSRYPKCDYITNSLDEAQAGMVVEAEPAPPAAEKSAAPTRKSTGKTRKSA
ncbi:MAG: DNA topoisomerase 1 [Chloroflexus sp.]|uniref:type I DNA topoisomerase n=1 Tax=Chloroflexus sp. TaxID=1904827 RepID=UPI0021DD9609|nr:type I DNA topoisomerase [Chloroflexus sp.]GIV90552.1 MAG: DNA topoisomerase 1 [Chloroflexus sp.]